VSLVIFVTALVLVSTFPREGAHAVLLVVFIRPFVGVAILSIESLFPLAFAVLEAFFELAHIDTAVLPLVLAVAFWLSELVGAREHVSVGKNVAALAMFEAVVPLALVPIAVLPLMHSVSIYF